MKTDPGGMKILAIIPSGFCFGLQHVTVDFFSRFAPNIQSHFLLTRWSNGDMEKLLLKSGIPYSYSWLGMFSRKMDWKNLKMSLHALSKMPRLYYDFIRIYRKIKPDILYFANHHELILLFPLLLFVKRKVVCHIHDPAPAIGFQKMTFWWYDKVVRQYIAISEDVRQRTIALGCRPGKIQTVHNGIVIPASRQSPRDSLFCKQAGWPETAVIIGITGQMIEKKGHLDLLDAFKMVYEKNEQARLLIGGKKQEPLNSMLIDRIRQWGFEHLVDFAGWQPDVNTFFQNIDVYVLASQHDEGYGLVVAEAMANKVPVVVTASGGAVEIPENNLSGYIVPKRSPEEMADKIYLLISNPELRKDMGERGRLRIIDQFDLDKQVVEFTGLLSRIKQ